MIKAGLYHDPDKKADLRTAPIPAGTCRDMCAEFERMERIKENAVDRCEKVSELSPSINRRLIEIGSKRERRPLGGSWRDDGQEI